MSESLSTEDRLRALSEVLRDMESVESVDLKLGGACDALRVETDASGLRATIPSDVVDEVYGFGLAVHSWSPSSGLLGVTTPSGGRSR